MNDVEADLKALADEELAMAAGLPWRELVKTTPWADSYTALTPGGREAEVMRAYLWAGEPGGAVHCEVEARLSDDGPSARASLIIQG
ncbi:hypothetical protein Q0812_07245 [Brevundimonas sp. 2R-24]|uniref:Uncharacterized protein n=1 Tax=Peiella sedimenti TaxID=3061083 RepID=A0ABT8SPK9_9CAUL|nr:hypothetical protein [Caulobacteraceae bacterium XZ-24]